MQALINDNNPIYVTDNTPAAEQRYRARFYFDPNSIVMAKNDANLIFVGNNAAGTAVLQLEMRFNSGYQLRANVADDRGRLTSTAWITLTDASHYFEVDWRAATTSGSKNGGVTLWIDGVQTALLSTVANNTLRVDSVQLGAVSGIDSTTRGTVYFDAFDSRRSNYIGP